MLEARQLSKNVGATPILRGVDVTLSRGKITGILSLEKIETRVLLSLLSGHERPHSGSIVMGEKELKPLARGFRRGVKLVPGTARLFSELSLEKNLVLALGVAQGYAATLSQASACLSEFGFERPLKTVAGELTIPEQQLVSLVIFLLQEDEVLLVRDVLSNLTLDQYQLFTKKIRSLAARRAIAVVPDHPSQLFDFCDDALLLRNGRGIASPVSKLSLDQVFNILNNSEHTILQALENKFHRFQAELDHPQSLYEQGLVVLANFCGVSQAFILSSESGRVGLTLAREWRGAPLPKADLESAWSAALAGERQVLGGRFTWSRLKPPGAGETLLFYGAAGEPDFPFAQVVSGLSRCLELLAERLHREASARQRELESVRLHKEMDIARNLQASILPRAAELPGYEVAVLSETATEVGGDSWDLLPTELGTFLSIGDVSGHGLPAGVMALIEMAALHGVVQTHLQYATKPDPSVVYDLVNRVLCEINRDRIGSDKFMTKLLLIENQGEFLHGGTHEVGLLYKKKDGAIHELDSMVDRTGFLGLSHLLDSSQSLGRFRMDEGDVLLLYTDGLIEAKNAAGEQFGIARVKESLLANPARAATVVLADLKMQLYAFARDGDCLKHAGRLADDLTLILLRREKLAPSPDAL